ncbi:MAG: histidinol dehydrogenase [Lysobacterales bacterium]
MNITIPELIDWPGAGETQRKTALGRPALPAGDFKEVVSNIIARVGAEGDRALREIGEKYDAVVDGPLEVTEAEWAVAETLVAPPVLRAMDEAIPRIRSFHLAGVPLPFSKETAPGLRCEARYLPISPVGLYVPGGSAPLISTVIMLGVPAQIAGCREIILCTPPNVQGQVPPAILAAASRCGIERVFKVGGAQSIAAMGLGTESIPACAKLFGPGNAWVTEAKQQISAMPGGAARDMPAGPSEVLVVADKGADATAVCWDLLSQAEHGPDSQAIVISDSRALLEEIGRLLPGMAARLPRAAVLAESLQHLRRIRVDTILDAIEISNRYAPEHLILNCVKPDRAANKVTAAGSVFIGPWTPESLGDYCSGTNHVLPTYGYARAYSGLSVIDFLRRMTLQRASHFGLRGVGPCASTLAGAEGLDAHRMAVEYRLEVKNRK